MCSSVYLIFSIILISAVSTIPPILATDHIVGANKGWNPNINYTLWANNHTFYVGDLICKSSLSLCLFLSSFVSVCVMCWIYFNCSKIMLKDLENPLFLFSFISFSGKKIPSSESLSDKNEKKEINKLELKYFMSWCSWVKIKFLKLTCLSW